MQAFVFSLTCLVTAALLSACQPSDTANSKTKPPTQENEQTNAQPSADDEIVVAEDNNVGELVPATEQNNAAIEQAKKVAEINQNYQRALSDMQAQMQLMQSINDMDLAFARSMLGHHRGAIDLTRLQQRYGTDEQLTKLAANINQIEQNEINMLRKWMASHPDTNIVEDNTDEMRRMYGYAISAMDKRIQNAIDGQNPDLTFAKIMLAHHYGAQALAKLELKYGTDTQMQALAKQIINEQQQEIQQLVAWLKQHGHDPAPKLIQVESDDKPEDGTNATNTPQGDEHTENSGKENTSTDLEDTTTANSSDSYD